MDNGLFLDKLKRTEEFKTTSQDLAASVVEQKELRKEFSRLKPDEHDDAKLIKTAKIVKKAARDLEKREHVRELEEDIMELDTQMAPVEESDKDRKKRLDEVAREKSTNKDVDHVSIALKREMLKDERAEEDPLPVPEPEQEFASCLEALKKLDPAADFTGEDYVTEHADELNSLIKNGEAFITFNDLRQNAQDQATRDKLDTEFNKLSQAEQELVRRISLMAAPAKAARQKLCRLKGIDPDTGEFLKAPLDKKTRSKLQDDLKSERKRLKTQADAAVSFKKKNMPKKKETKAETAAKRQALVAELDAKKRKRDEVLKEAKARKRIQDLIDKHKGEYPPEVRERKEEKLKLDEQDIMFRIKNEKTATHLLLSLDILRSLGTQLDMLKDRFYLEDKCVRDHYRNTYNEEPDANVDSLLKERIDEIWEREAEYSNAIKELEKRISKETDPNWVPLDEKQEKSWRKREETRFAEAMEALTPQQKTLPEAAQRRLARNMIIREKRAASLVKLEETRAVNVESDKAYDKQRHGAYPLMDEQNQPFTAMDKDLYSSYDVFQYQYKLEHPDAEIPPAEEMEKIADEYLRTIMQKNTSLQIRVPNGEVLKAILKSGRFKTLMETKKSGGADDVAGRKDFAHNKFGVDPATFPNSKYEIYGYLSDGDHVRESQLTQDKKGCAPGNTVGLSGQYGQVIVKLNRKRMLMRTTVCFGDSLENETNCSPAFMDNPDVMSVAVTERLVMYKKAYEWHKKKQDGDLLGAEELENLNNFMQGMSSRMSYAELQFHGGVSVDDIESVTLAPKMEGKLTHEEETEFSDDVLKELDKNGITAYVVKGTSKTEVHPKSA